jgi:hypothetical protein
VRKSSTADATTRTWMIIADETTCLIFIQSADNASVYYCAYLGEFYSYVAADPYKNILMGRADNSGLWTDGSMAAVIQGGIAYAALANHYQARSYAGGNAGAACLKTVFFSPTNNGVGCTNDNTPPPYPDPATGGLNMSPFGVWTTAATFGLHGELRGVFAINHGGNNFADGDTFSGTGAFAGRTFVIVKTIDSKLTVGSSNPTNCCIAVETTAWPRST